MSADYHAAISRLMQSAYRSAPRKKACIEAMRQIPTLLKWFSKTEHQQRVGYSAGLCDAAPDRQFWMASMAHGSDSNDCYFFTDPDAVEKYIEERFPEALVREVLES